MIMTIVFSHEKFVKLVKDHFECGLQCLHESSAKGEIGQVDYHNKKLCQ